VSVVGSSSLTAVAASALIIVNNYETITQAAVVLHSATMLTGASPYMTSHNRTLSRGATRWKLRISSAEKNSLFYDPRISRPRTFRSRFCGKILW